MCSGSGNSYHNYDRKRSFRKQETPAYQRTFLVVAEENYRRLLPPFFAFLAAFFFAIYLLRHESTALRQILISSDAHRPPYAPLLLLAVHVMCEFPSKISKEVLQYYSSLTIAASVDNWRNLKSVRKCGTKTCENRFRIISCNIS